MPLRPSIIPISNSVIPFCSKLPLQSEMEPLYLEMPAEMDLDKLSRSDCHRLTMMLQDIAQYNSESRVSVASIYCSTFLPESELKSKYLTEKESREKGTIGLEILDGEKALASMIFKKRDLDANTANVDTKATRLFEGIFQDSHLVALLWFWEQPGNAAGHAMLVVFDQNTETVQLLDPNGGDDDYFTAIFQDKINDLVIKQLRALLNACKKGDYRIELPRFDHFNGFARLYQEQEDEKHGIQYKGDKHGLCLFVSLYFLAVYMCGSGEHIFKKDFWKRRFKEITGDDPFVARRQYHALMYFRAFVYLLVSFGHTTGKMRKTIWKGPMITYTRESSLILRVSSDQEREYKREDARQKRAKRATEEKARREEEKKRETAEAKRSGTNTTKRKTRSSARPPRSPRQTRSSTR